MKKIIIILITILLGSAVLSGCSSQKPNEGNVAEVSLENIHKAVKESLGEDYIPSRDMDESELVDMIDLDMDDIQEYIAQGPMMSTHVDTYISVKAKDGEADDVEEDLNEYREYLIENSLMYPMNIAKVNASEVVRHGDYVFFIMLGAFDDSNNSNEEQQLRFAKNEVNKVKETINKFFK